MNLLEGKIGKQEASCSIFLAISIGLLCGIPSTVLYSGGNVSYLAVLIGSAVSLAIFLFTAYAMKTSGQLHLMQLFRYALGKPLGILAALPLIVSMLFVPASCISSFLIILSRFVFTQASGWDIALYLVPVILILSLLGFETIARTAKIYFWVFVFSVAVILLVLTGSYETYRLNPLLGSGTGQILSTGLCSTWFILPGLCIPLLAAQGVHGTANARKTGLIAGIGSGVLAALTQVCTGMIYPHHQLTSLPLPFYELTLRMPQARYMHRMDKVLLVIGVIASLIASSLYVYSAALLFARAFDQRDVRPAIVSLTGVFVGLVFFLHLNLVFFEPIASFLYRYGWLFAAVPLLAASGIACIKCRRKNQKENKHNEQNI